MAYTENRVDDAVQQAHSRRQFLRGGATAGVAALLAAAAPRAAFAKQMPQELNNDADILNFALTLEHIEAEFYKMAVDSGHLSGQALTILEKIRDNEVDHVEILTGALEAENYEDIATADVVNTDAFNDYLGSQAKILELANIFEPVGVGAYTAAAPLIQNKADYLPVAGGIEQLEARHQGAVRWLVDLNPSPDDDEFALGPTLPPADVVEAVTPFLNS